MNKKMMTLAVAAALATPTLSHAVKYKLSGQINRAMVVNSDGTNSDVQFIDNTASGSRWRMKGSEDIGNGTKVGFNWEWQAQSNAAGGAMGAGDTAGFRQDLRKSEVWFSSSWGKLSLGKGSGAGDGTTEIDLSNTWTSGAYVSQADINGNIAWRTGAGGFITSSGGTTTSAAAGLVHGETYSYFDAFSRYNRLRYDSPSLGPVTLSVSGGQADKYEGAARWSQGLGGGQISAGLFYGTDNGGGVKNRYGGSVAYLFSFGLNLAVSYSENEPSAAGSTKQKNIYGKLGYTWANNSVSIGYGEAKDIVDGFKDKGFNIGFNHNIPKAKVDVYAGYQFSQLDTPTTVDVDDIMAFNVGALLKFD